MPDLATRFRRARESFVLGCQLGTTPARAMEIEDERQTRARWEAADRRLAAKMSGRAAAPLKPATTQPDAPRPRRWWED